MRAQTIRARSRLASLTCPELNSAVKQTILSVALFTAARQDFIGQHRQCYPNGSVHLTRIPSQSYALAPHHLPQGRPQRRDGVLRVAELRQQFVPLRPRLSQVSVALSASSTNF